MEHNDLCRAQPVRSVIGLAAYRRRIGRLVRLRVHNGKLIMIVRRTGITPPTGDVEGEDRDQIRLDR
jgi:hypothetical protein